VLRPVAGLGPGEQTGMCLLGMAAGVPLADVLRVRCGGGVDVRLVIAGALATIVAIIQGSQVGVRERVRCEKLARYRRRKRAKRA